MQRGRAVWRSNNALPPAQSKDTLTLTIGYHQLEGKKMPLKKPLAILEKDEAKGGEGGIAYKASGRGLMGSRWPQEQLALAGAQAAWRTAAIDQQLAAPRRC